MEAILNVLVRCIVGYFVVLSACLCQFELKQHFGHAFETARQRCSVAKKLYSKWFKTDSTQNATINVLYMVSFGEVIFWLLTWIGVSFCRWFWYFEMQCIDALKCADEDILLSSVNVNVCWAKIKQRCIFYQKMFYRQFARTQCCVNIIKPISTWNKINSTFDAQNR